MKRLFERRCKFCGDLEYDVSSAEICEPVTCGSISSILQRQVQPASERVQCHLCSIWILSGVVVIDVKRAPVFVERRRSRATSANNGRHDSEKEQLRVEVPGDWRVHFCASSVARGLWPFHREGITPPLIQQRMSTTRRQTLWAIWATWWKPADVMNGRFGMQSSHTESYVPAKSGAE